MKLFWTKRHRRHWVAFSQATGLVIFPAELNGWHRRQPAMDVQSDELHEIPLRLAVYTGLPGSIAVKRGRRAA